MRVGLDSLRGDSGADHLFGDDGGDGALGGGGADTLDGGAGSDDFLGGSGPDTIKADYPDGATIQPERVAGVSGIFAADGSPDNIDCGQGSDDTVYFDADLDNIIEGCANQHPQ